MFLVKAGKMEHSGLRVKQALFEYTPTPGRRIYKKFQHGKHAVIFLLDERSFRGANTDWHQLLHEPRQTKNLLDNAQVIQLSFLS